MDSHGRITITMDRITMDSHDHHGLITMDSHDHHGQP